MPKKVKPEIYRKKNGVDEITFYLTRDIDRAIMIMKNKMITPTIQTLDLLLNTTQFKKVNKKYEDQTLEKAKLLFQMGLQYNEEALVMACRHKHLLLAQEITNNKVIPTQVCFNVLFTDIFGNEKYKPTKSKKVLRKTNEDIEKDKITQFIDLLTTSGYQLTYQDVVTATKHHYEIPYFNRFNIVLHHTFATLCTREGFYPTYMPNTNNIHLLEIECNKPNNFVRIRDMIKNGTKPNLICLENACKNGNNYQTVNIIMENGVEPTLGCLVKVANVIKNKTMSAILVNYIKSLKNKDDTKNIKI